MPRPASRSTSRWCSTRSATRDDVVVVGHSLGGLTASVVAERRPVRELVLLAALVPKPGVAVADDMAAFADTFADGWEAHGAEQRTGDDGSTSWPLAAAVDVFYHDCDPPLADWAARHLRAAVVDRCHPAQPAARVPRRAHPRHRLPPTTGSSTPRPCARLATERFGARITRLGSGHSPMLSQPEALADALTSGLA